MKTKFRVVLSSSGWTVQFNNFRSLLNPANDNWKTAEYWDTRKSIQTSRRIDAVAAVDLLQKGIIPIDPDGGTNED